MLSKTSFLVTLCLGFLLFAPYTPAKVGISASPTTVTASWYGPHFHGRKTANGERFNMNAMTAAHKTLPMGSVLLVTSLESKKSVKVRINDRGPYHAGRSIDLSRAAAKKIGVEGVEQVKVVLLSR